MIVLAIKLTKNLGCSNNHDNGFDFPPAVTITDITIDTDRNGCSDTTSMLARFVVICFCLQFVFIIIIFSSSFVLCLHFVFVSLPLQIVPQSAP